MNIVTGIETMDEGTVVPTDSTQDVTMKDNVSAMPERIKKRSETSPTKRRSSGENADRNNDAAVHSGENNGISTQREQAAPRRTSGEKEPRRTSGEKNNSKTENPAPRRISGEKKNVGNSKTEMSAPRRTSGEKNNTSKTETAAPRRTSGEKNTLKNNKSESTTPRRTSGDKTREQGATSRRTSGEKSHFNNSSKIDGAPRRHDGEAGHQSHNNSKSDSVTPRRVSGEKKNKNEPVKQSRNGPSDSTDRYFTRSNSDSERSGDDDNSIGNVPPANAVLSNSDDFSIDPLANFLPRAIDDSIHRRTLGSAQVSLAESRISEDSGLEVRPTRRGRRNHANKAPPTTSRAHKARVSPRSKRSHLNRSGSTDASALDYGASRKSLSSASDTSSHDTNAVAATFMQFTLNEKGFVQELSKDHNVESESTLRLARAVAESDVPHLPAYDLDESAAIDFEDSDPGNLENEDDAADRNRQVRQEHGIKSRFNQIGRKLRDVQRSFSSDEAELFTAAHASFMRSSSSGGGIFGLCDEPSSENNGDDVMLEN